MPHAHSEGIVRAAFVSLGHHAIKYGEEIIEKQLFLILIKQLFYLACPFANYIYTLLSVLPGKTVLSVPGDTNSSFCSGSFSSVK